MPSPSTFPPFAASAAPQTQAASWWGRLWRAPMLWALCGLMIGALAVLLWRAPASWLAWAIDSATEGRAQVLDPQGTVWQGDGKLLLTGGKGSKDAMLLPQRMRWKLSPSWGQADVRMDLDCCATTPAHVVLTPSLQGADMQVRSLDWKLPAELLEGLGAPLNSLALRGDVTLHAKDVSWTQSGKKGAMQGSVTVDLLGMSTAMSTLDALGSYRVTIKGNEADSGGAPRMQLRTQEGPLQLEGEGAWRDGRFRFAGSAWSDAGYESRLNNLLNMMGNKSGERYRLAL